MRDGYDDGTSISEGGDVRMGRPSLTLNPGEAFGMIRAMGGLFHSSPFRTPFPFFGFFGYENTESP